MGAGGYPTTQQPSRIDSCGLPVSPRGIMGAGQIVRSLDGGIPAQLCRYPPSWHVSCNAVSTHGGEGGNLERLWGGGTPL